MELNVLFDFFEFLILVCVWIRLVLEGYGELVVVWVVVGGGGGSEFVFCC